MVLQFKLSEYIIFGIRINFLLWQEYGYANAQIYVYGNGLCLSWDEGTLMEYKVEDTWELTLTYTQTPVGYG